MHQSVVARLEHSGDERRTSLNEDKEREELVGKCTKLEHDMLRICKWSSLCVISSPSSAI
jgi:hypothetical protein